MHRNLAIFDLRNTSQKTFVNTKAIQGVTVDPHFQDRVASFFEGQVAIWDLRKFEKPVFTLTEQPKTLTKVAWCPTRMGLLATLTRDSNIIRLYDMQHTPVPFGDEVEPTIIERSVQPAARASSAASPGIRLPRTAWWWCRPTGSWTTSPSLSAYRWPGAPPRRWCGRAGGTCMSARRTPDRGRPLLRRTSPLRWGSERSHVTAMTRAGVEEPHAGRRRRPAAEVALVHAPLYPSLQRYGITGDDWTFQIILCQSYCWMFT